MSTETLNKRGLRPLESILLQIGGWPMVMDKEEWDAEGQSWKGVEEHYFHITGSFIFYQIRPSWYEDRSLTVRNYFFFFLFIICK